MQLAHAIIMDSDIQLLHNSDQSQCSQSNRIETMMNDTFWSNLTEQLNSKPPLFNRAITVLGYIKEVISWNINYLQNSLFSDTSGVCLFVSFCKEF